jgi:hypothetical protein
MSAGGTNDREDTTPGDGHPAPSVRHIGTVEFVGDFQPVEREFLAGQFSDCRFELLARSALSPHLALVMWHGAAPAASRGPSPLSAAPRQAAYVLATGDEAMEQLGADHGAASGGVRSRAGRRGPAGPALARVDSDGDLHARFRDHFPSVRLRLPFWDRVRRGWRGWLPGLLVLVVAGWLVSLAWALRG